MKSCPIIEGSDTEFQWFTTVWYGIECSFLVITCEYMKCTVCVIIKEIINCTLPLVLGLAAILLSHLWFISLATCGAASSREYNVLQVGGLKVGSQGFLDANFCLYTLGLKRVLNLLPGYPTLITRRVPGYSLQWISSLTNAARLPTSTFFVYFIREIMKKYVSACVLNNIRRPLVL